MKTKDLKYAKFSTGRTRVDCVLTTIRVTIRVRTLPLLLCSIANIDRLELFENVLETCGHVDDRDIKLGCFLLDKLNNHLETTASQNFF